MSILDLWYGRRPRDTTVSKRFYISGQQNDHMKRIAKERGITQQELFGDMVVKLIADSYKSSKGQEGK